MKERIQMIANHKKKSRVISLCCILCILLLIPIVFLRSRGIAATAPSAGDMASQGGIVNMAGEVTLSPNDSEETLAIDLRPYYETVIQMEHEKGLIQQWPVQDQKALISLMKQLGMILDQELEMKLIEAENDSTKDDAIVVQIIDAYYPAREGILNSMDIVAKEFGPYEEWSIELRAWYSAALQKVGDTKPRAMNILPQENDISQQQAQDIGRDYLMKVRGKSTEEIDAMTLHIYFQLPSYDNRVADKGMWYLNYYDDANPNDLYFVYLNHDGSVSEAGGPRTQPLSSTEELNERFNEILMRHQDEFFTVTGLAAFARDFAPQINAALQRGETILPRAAYFAGIPYSLPQANDVSQEVALSIAEDTILEHTGWTKAMLYEGYKPSASYRLSQNTDGYLDDQSESGEWRFGFRIPPSNRSGAVERYHKGEIPFCFIVRIDAATGQVIELSESMDNARLWYGE